jgi:Spy/CpxP family protein refolding chaperone
MVAVMALSASIVYADNAGSAPAVADPAKDKKECPMMKGHHLMAEILNLTGDQQKQLEDIKQKQEETMKISFEAVKTAKEALNAEIVKATSDTAKITDLQNQLKAAQAQMADNHLNKLLAIKKIMTPEQFAGYMALEKAEEIMKHEHHGFGGKFGEHGPWGKGMGEHKDGGNEGPADRPEGDEK